jgi:single-stranded DNA-binding protein
VNTQIIGFLRYNVDMKFTQDGNALANFTVYDTDHGEYKTKQRVIAWQELGETCNRELSFSSKVFIQGYYKNRSWVDKESQLHTVKEFIAQRVWELDNTPDEMSHAREIKYEEATKVE